MFTIETTSEIASLLANATAWNGLSRGVPFRETSWIGTWWKHFGGGREAYVVVARDQAGVIRGLLPLYRKTKGSDGRSLGIMGDGEACSDYASILADRIDTDQIAEMMGLHLASNAGCSRWGWDLLDIDGVVEGEPGMTALARGLESGGAALHGSSRMSVWFKPTDDHWEAHLRHYGKTQRRKMRRWSERVGEGAIFQQRTAETEQQVEALISDLIAMHQQRWNDVGETGSFADPRFRRFIRDAAQDFLHRGQLYLSGLEYQGKIVAAELSFIGGNGILYVYSAGFDISQSELEPGRVLSIDTLLHLYRNSLSGIDYLRGDEEYKKRYTTESRRLIRMRAVAPTLLPQLRHAAWRTGFELKQWVRRQTGRQPTAVVDLTSAPHSLPTGTVGTA